MTTIARVAPVVLGNRFLADLAELPVSGHQGTDVAKNKRKARDYKPHECALIVLKLLEYDPRALRHKLAEESEIAIARRALMLKIDIAERLHLRGDASGGAQHPRLCLSCACSRFLRLEDFLIRSGDRPS